MADNNSRPEGGDAWQCLTPATDANGRLLTMAERLNHAAVCLGRLGCECIESLDRQIRADPDVSAAQHRAMLRAGGELIRVHIQAMIERLAVDLQMDPSLDHHSDALH